MTASCCLRRSSSPRAASARRRRIAGSGSAASCGSTGAPGLPTAISAIWNASARENAGAACRGPEAPHVEVVDDLLEQVADVLDEDAVARRVAGDAEPAEHLLAEAVGGGDRRGVEVRERAGEVPVAALDRRARPVGEQPHDLVARVRLGARQHRAERPLGAHQPLADALAQLAGRHPRERDEQQVVERRAVRDVARRERGDRVRLAGAGARLEHGDPARQRPADVERLAVGEQAHASRTSSRRSSPSHSRRAQRPKRVGSRSSQPGPDSSGRGACSHSSANVRSPPSTSRCSGSRSSLSKFQVDSHASAASRAAFDAGARVGGRGRAGERRRLAHAAVVEVEQDRELRARLARVQRRDPRDGHRAVGAAARATDGQRVERPLRVGGGQREQPHPGREPVARADARVAHRAQRVADHARHRPAEQPAARQRDAHVDGLPGRRRPPARRRRRRSARSRRRPAARARPGGSVPRAISARIASRRPVPASRASSRRWPTCHCSSASSSTGSASSISSSPARTVTPSRRRRNARTGCATNATRSSSSTICVSSGGSGPGRNGPGSTRSASSARAPSSVTRSKLHGARRDQLAGGEVARVERLQRVADEDRAGVAAGERAVDHVEQLADRHRRGRGRFVRSSLPV